VASDLQGEPPPPPDKKLGPDTVASKAPPPPQAKRLLEQQQEKHAEPLTQLPENYVEPAVEPEKIPTAAEVGARLTAMEKAYPKRDRAQDVLARIRKALGDKPDDAHLSDAKTSLDNLENNMPPPVPIVLPKSGAGGSASRPRVKDGEAVVVDTSSKSGAARAGIGWLTLYTVPPTEVYDGETNLGTTPLIRVPLDGKTYKLRVIDPEGQNRWLSAMVKPGEELKLKVRVTDLPLE